LELSLRQRVEQIFSERVALWSERTAIKIGERRVSYGQLDTRSNGLAQRLIQTGVGRNRIVAVATGNIEYFAVAVLAMLKAGAAYLAVDTRYPVERVRGILTDAAPTILLADTELPASLIPALDPYSSPSLEAAANADDTACIFYNWCD
jgi:non-ribosomal peptide synthetase component F